MKSPNFIIYLGPIAAMLPRKHQVLKAFGNCLAIAGQDPSLWVSAGYICKHSLVDGFKHVLFSISYRMSSFPLTFIFCRGVGIPPTRFLSGGTVTLYFQTIHISIIPTKCGPGASVIARQVLAGSAVVFWSDHSWSDGTSIDSRKWGKSTKLLGLYLVMIFWFRTRCEFYHVFCGVLIGTSP